MDAVRNWGGTARRAMLIQVCELPRKHDAMSGTVVTDGFRTGRLVCRLLLVLLLGQCAGSLADDDYNRAKALVAEGNIMPLERLLELIRPDHPGRLLEIELKGVPGGFRYEVELLDPEGRVREFQFDAATGVLLDRREED
jgi:hypothetical protein